MAAPRTPERDEHALRGAEALAESDGWCVPDYVVALLDDATDEAGEEAFLASLYALGGDAYPDAEAAGREIAEWGTDDDERDERLRSMGLGD